MARIITVGSRLLPLTALVVVVFVVTVVVFRTETSSFDSPTPGVPNGNVTLENGMLVNVILAAFDVAGIAAEKVELARDVRGSAGSVFYSIGSRNSNYELIVTASRKKGESDTRVNEFCFEWKYQSRQPTTIPGEEPIEFESLSVMQIKEFQDNGTIPSGGTKVSIP